jgi:hypothetical protein
MDLERMLALYPEGKSFVPWDNPVAEKFLR